MMLLIRKFLGIGQATSLSTLMTTVQHANVIVSKPNNRTVVIRDKVVHLFVH